VKGVSIVDSGILSLEETKSSSVIRVAIIGMWAEMSRLLSDMVDTSGDEISKAARTVKKEHLIFMSEMIETCFYVFIITISSLYNQRSPTVSLCIVLLTCKLQVYSMKMGK
jgi:hypothetical protein